MAQAARGRLDLLAELDSADAVRCIKPDLASVGMLKARGLVVTAPGETDIDCGYIDVHLNGDRVDLTGGAVTITRGDVMV
ncbi:hypothetical protein [Mycobacterium sp. E3247]|uniref:hypothetical protein n=1 Tax=Mycobacterium sp. E3247 TaxID=1856864 RepID=UPI0009ED9866|nr:hypothetical protein [Mycobacterium sp. E3247]